MLAQQLAVSAETALLELRDEPRVKVAPVEPEEPLALAAHLCALAEEGVAAVLTGGTARSVRLLAAAAARAGVPLLLADSAPKNHTWEVLALYPDNRVLAQVRTRLRIYRVHLVYKIIMNIVMGYRLVRICARRKAGNERCFCTREKLRSQR